jgi:small subunit ribosomal protein S6
MRHYESVVILDPDLTDDDVKSFSDEYTNIISGRGGEVIKVDDWGRKRLAYLVNKKEMGRYILVDYVGDPAVLSEVERRFKISDQVMKFLSVKLSETADPDALRAEVARQEEEKAEAARRAAERAAQAAQAAQEQAAKAAAEAAAEAEQTTAPEEPAASTDTSEETPAEAEETPAAVIQEAPDAQAETQPESTEEPKTSAQAEESESTSDTEPAPEDSSKEGEETT